ncbi:MAG: hypothetical protein OEV42_14095 [Deltaproteobacteria bacterium]|nr:hypothetical protein [Deltaproteobacteria bacterium]
MEEINYLKEALEIEKEALENAKRCYDFYSKSGDTELAQAIKSIRDDEEKHVSKIEVLIKKMEVK